MKMTIKEIAKLAGVSRATVSKIINNYDDVGEQTKKRVKKIMEQYNYRPSYSAKTLATNETMVIGVIYAGKVNADFNHHFFVEVVNMFKKTIGQMGYDLLFFSNEQFHKENEDYLARCLHYNVDGCIIISGGDVEPTVYELDKSEIPCVGVDLELFGNNSSYIMSDNYKIISEGIQHLKRLGHEQIAYIGGEDSSQVARLREQYFKQIITERNLTTRTDWVKKGDFFEESGYVRMNEILHLKEHPKAIFAGSDLMALGIMRAIREHGLNVEDYSIIGVDDIHAAQYVDPPLTTMRQNKEKIGELAATMLQQLISDQQVERKVFVDPELVVRQSCGAAKFVSNEKK
ncbi:LacI family DNA-binding transcriptional regulator [Evansella halocellulosilytica]|uniref:LacI family DNA-binding transcriptional regulator n=1 Tax=Evansella halocellulosilytica TaxID=2011013 RepID=UPI000BB6BE4F|nr:LacI family DNA-binding transcriptional regulator [Evansella halocellulosilytica]